MNCRDFCFWLHGYIELGGELTPDKIQIIKDHLGLVFKKETPIFGGQEPFSTDMHKTF